MDFYVAMPGYNVEEDGEWEGKRLIPFVALAGDSLLEPFWPMGLGLKRGWQAIMDTTFAIDNLYNPLLFMEKLGKTEDDMEWEEHMDELKSAVESNFEYCNRLQVSAELALGEYDDKSLIMTQLKKRIKDPEKPPFQVEIDPTTRYKPLADEVAADYRKLPKEKKDEYIHPVVQKAVNRKKYYDDITAGGKSGEFEYRGKELVSINGRVVGGFKQAGKTAGGGGGKKPIGAGKAQSRRGKKAAEPAAGGE